MWLVCFFGCPVATGPFSAWAAAVSTPGVAAVASGSTPAKAAAMRPTLGVLRWYSPRSPLPIDRLSSEQSLTKDQFVIALAM